jgi:hypothetical protein
MRRGVGWLVLSFAFGCGGNVHDDRGARAGGGGDSGQGGSAGMGAAGGATSGGTAGATSDTGGSAGAGMVDLCDLPPEVGPCDGSIARHYYDPATAKCQGFVYGGCQGNANNFPSQAACETACQQRVFKCALCNGPCFETDCSHCPKDNTAAGMACDTVGLTCQFGPKTLPNVCLCRARSATEMTWQCSVVP